MHVKSGFLNSGFRAPGLDITGDIVIRDTVAMGWPPEGDDVMMIGLTAYGMGKAFIEKDELGVQTVVVKRMIALQ